VTTSDDDDEMTEGDSQQIDALLKATLGKYSGACGLLLFPYMRRY